MPTSTMPDSADVAELAPMAERALSIDPLTMLRIRADPGLVAGFIRLPYDVVAGRALLIESERSYDITVAATDFLRWVDDAGDIPQRHDAHWLTPLPPRKGWHRVEIVPDSTLRDLIRSGAQLAREAASKPAQEALVNSIVLTATSPGHTVDVPLGAVSALTRMGFLPRGTSAAIDVAPGWVRVAAQFGSTFVASAGNALGLLGGLSIP
ncbi:hypothetical protein ACSMXN_09595 [Jatrophihabitans sp. DSM 45814]